jgi:2'-5' RNA ligase
VQFLGDDADLAAVATVFELDPVQLEPAAIRLGGAEALGNRRRARILALGLQEGADWVRRLAAQVERRLAPLGYERDDRDRPLRPHLTLARFRAPTDLRALCGDIGSDPVGPAWRVEEMVLYESELQPGGAQHTARTRLPVGR